MASKNNRRSGARPAAPQQDKPATLKDLLSADVMEKLKKQAEELKAEETRREERKRVEREEARKAEQKRLENDFEYLLNNNKQNWKDFK